MFTGIIEASGIIQSAVANGSGKTFWVASSLSPQLKVDQSLSHNGVCLTVEEVTAGKHRVTAIQETLEKTDLAHWNAGRMVNLERCLSLNSRLDGHLVQGHVDATATCIERRDLNGSWEFRFRFPASFASLVIEKGSICLNGISLTAFDVGKDEFTVAIIPYTYEHTNMNALEVSSTVNLEFDLIGKYILRHLTTKD